MIRFRCSRHTYQTTGVSPKKERGRELEEAVVCNQLRSCPGIEHRLDERRYHTLPYIRSPSTAFSVFPSNLHTNITIHPCNTAFHTTTTKQPQSKSKSRGEKSSHLKLRNSDKEGQGKIWHFNRRFGKENL